MTNSTTLDLQPGFWSRVPFLHPYALLARWDRPIGMWLVLWPAVWALLLSVRFRATPAIDQLTLLGLFVIGAVAVRGAGCTINDIIDRKLDATVARTAARPLASGRVGLVGATIFLVLQLSVGAAVLWQLPLRAIYVGVAALPLIALYPWMKRITHWPQLFLGLVFNLGVFVAWLTVEDTVTPAIWTLYAASVLWTLAYDSIYAYMDAQDDAKVGIKSTVLLWGMRSKMIIGWLWVMQTALVLLAMVLATGYGYAAYGMVLASMAINQMGHIFWNPINDRYSLAYFRLQSRIGLMIAMALAIPILF